MAPFGIREADGPGGHLLLPVRGAAAHRRAARTAPDPYGLVGADIDLRAGDPAPLRKLLVLPELRAVPVVLLHCYPFIREASWLAGLFPNVHVDLCMVLQWVVHRGPELILEALDVAPVSKLLFATDGFRVPELFYLGATWWRDDLADVLAGLVERDLVDEARAAAWGRSVLRENALRIYPFEEERVIIEAPGSPP